MPTYEFQCKACENQFEVFTSMSGKNRVKCPCCGDPDLKEVYGAFFVGGDVSNPGAGTGSCHGDCASCSSSCK